jgi:uncharacterized membrane protein YbhN (UPF0104 family)
MRRRMLRYAVIGGVLVLLLGGLYRSSVSAQIETMLATLRQLDLDTVITACLMTGLGIVLSGVEWWKLLGRMGHNVAYRSALTAYLSAGLAAFVVNSVGPAVGSAMVLRRHGVSPGRAALLTVIANTLGFCGILVWAPIGLLLLSQTGMDRTLPLIGSHGPLAAALVMLSAGVVMVLVLRALTTVADSRHSLARRLLGGRPADDHDRPSKLRTRQVLALLPWSAGSWVAGVGALYVVLTAMSPGASVNLADVVGAAMLAATLGSLAFFVPEGLGVGDGALVLLLTHATGLPATTCIAAAVAVRALDPMTKLSVLGVLALTAHPAAARFLARCLPSDWLRAHLLENWAVPHLPLTPAPTRP